MAPDTDDDDDLDDDDEASTITTLPTVHVMLSREGGMGEGLPCLLPAVPPASAEARLTVVFCSVAVSLQ